ncbi:MAG: hypothetical protein ACPGOX_06420 [Flavobacteriales bacterium]
MFRSAFLTVVSMRCFLSVLCLAAGVGSVMKAQVLTPTYDVEIKRPFAMPDFVAMDLGPDRIGMTQLFAGELQRAGFKVTSVAQAQKLMAPASQSPGHADTAIELYQMLDNIRKVDPSALPMKVRQMKKLARKSGVGKGFNFYITAGMEEAIRQGALMMLPGNRIAIAPDSAPPVLAEETEAWEPPVAYGFTFNYVYRYSLTCGETCSEVYASLNDLSSGELLASLRFDQPRISSACKNEIVHKLIEDLSRKGTVRVTAQVEANARPVQTVAVIDEGGVDCHRKSSETWAAEIATALLEQYAVVDRSNVDDVLKEQRTSMEVTFDASALVEAGRLVGAEGLVFVKAGCAAGRDVVDVKMTDTTLGTLCWSMHGENADAGILVKRLQEARQAP